MAPECGTSFPNRRAQSTFFQKKFKLEMCSWWERQKDHRMTFFSQSSKNLWLTEQQRQGHFLLKALPPIRPKRREESAVFNYSLVVERKMITAFDKHDQLYSFFVPWALLLLPLLPSPLPSLLPLPSKEPESKASRLRSRFQQQGITYEIDIWRLLIHSFSNLECT